MFWWPTCDINCHRIMGDYIVEFPQQLRSSIHVATFFLGAISDSTHSGFVTVCVLCFFFSFFEDFHGRPVYHKIMERCGWDCRSFACQAKMVVFEPKLSEATFRSAVKRCKKVISTFHGNFSWNNEWISVSCYHSWMAGRWFNKLSWDRKTSFSIFNIVRVS